MEFLRTTLGKTLAVLLGVFLVVGTVTALVDSITSYKSYKEGYRNTITVSADDKVIAKPDVATVSLSVVSKGKTVVEVTTDGNKKMNDIVAALKAMQIDEKDIQTSGYYLNPEQDYSIERLPNQTPKIIGYTLTQSVEVKVRKVDQAGDVVQKATDLGANNIGNINLTIDDQDKLKDEAREKAFAKARAKAETLARQAGVRLGKVISFSDDTATPYYDSYMNTTSYKEMPMSASADAVPAPSFETGSQEVHSSVSITYEID